MRSIRSWLMAAALALPLLGGCTYYTFHQAEGHRSIPLTNIRVGATTIYPLWATHEEQFWLCREEQNRVVCSRRCGDGTDIECPQGTFIY